MDKIESFSGENRFLSNFEITAFTYEGKAYYTAENAYQAAKCADLMEKLAIQESSPGKAKRLGQKCQMRPDWEKVKLGVMEDIVRIKFISNDVLRQRLIDTGDVELVEGNYWGDTFWGVYKGVGTNHLGKILMKVREEFKGL